MQLLSPVGVLHHPSSSTLTSASLLNHHILPIPPQPPLSSASLPIHPIHPHGSSSSPSTPALCILCHPIPPFRPFSTHTFPSNLSVQILSYRLHPSAYPSSPPLPIPSFPSIPSTSPIPCQRSIPPRPFPSTPSPQSLQSQCIHPIPSHPLPAAPSLYISIHPIPLHLFSSFLTALLKPILAHPVPSTPHMFPATPSFRTPFHPHPFSCSSSSTSLLTHHVPDFPSHAILPHPFLYTPSLLITRRPLHPSTSLTPVHSSASRLIHTIMHPTPLHHCSSAPFLHTPFHSPIPTCAPRPATLHILSHAPHPIQPILCTPSPPTHLSHLFSGTPSRHMPSHPPNLFPSFHIHLIPSRGTHHPHPLSFTPSSTSRAMHLHPST